MYVRTASSADSDRIDRLLAQATRQQMHLGSEEIGPAINMGRFLLLLRDAAAHNPGEASELLACLATAAEEDNAPQQGAHAVRCYVRGVAFAPQISPTTALQHLLNAFVQAADRTRPQRLIAYSAEPWLDRALRSAGMSLAERVHYFVLERLQQRVWPTAPATAPHVIKDATHGNLDALIALDSCTFDSIWRYSWHQMWDLWINGPMFVAWVGDKPAGYIAFMVEADTCAIARLAVAPTWQGHGLGRALLTAGLRLAQEAGCTHATLNTQATNHRSQELYRRFGFRPTGESFAVFVLDLPVASSDRPT